MASILDNILELVSPAILSQVTARTGESESAIVKGFGATIPSLLAGIANRSDDRGFMKGLTDLATSAAADPDSFKTAGGMDTTQPTGGWLSSLFGQNLSGVTDAISRYAGIRGSSVASLLATSAPLVLGYLGRMMKSDNLSVTGLAELLRSEQPQLMSALPSGLKTIFRAPAATVPIATSVRRNRTSGWGVPLMVLAALGVLGGIWWTARQNEELVQAPVNAVIGTAGEIEGMITRSLPGNITLRLPSGSTEDRLVMYLMSASKGTTALKIDRIGFDTGSASLTPQSREQLDNIAAILRAYPNADVTVAGYTDNAGDAASNLALSRARAESVAGALSKGGVAAGRVHAEGYGSGNPVADNLTEAGRSQNRRVVLEVQVK